VVGSVAVIFSKTFAKGIFIQEYPEREMFGKLVPAHEAMPGSEQWGRAGLDFYKGREGSGEV